VENTWRGLGAGTADGRKQRGMRRKVFFERKERREREKKEKLKEEKRKEQKKK
jgi:hypothetical protein